MVTRSQHLNTVYDKFDGTSLKKNQLTLAENLKFLSICLTSFIPHITGETNKYFSKQNSTNKQVKVGIIFQHSWNLWISSPL